MRMRSLQGRMMVLSAVASVLVTLLFGWAIAAVLERFVVQGLDGRLDAELSLLAAAVGPDGSVDRARLDGDRGGLAAGPGWRWRLDGPDGSIGSAPRLTVGMPPPPPPPDGDGGPPVPAGPRPIDGIGAEGEPVHARVLVLTTRRGPVQLLAEAPRSVVRQPIRAALVPLLLLLAALLVLLTAAALLQLRIGLAPVRRLREQVEMIRTGQREGVDEDQPDELRPLALELNALAADNRTALQAARRSGANLAHALKTPVAVLALELRDDPARLEHLSRIDVTIRHHLGRARLALADRRSETALRPAVDGVSRAIRHLHAERAVLIRETVADGLMVSMDSTDLDEMLGNLLDNAAAHARGEVWLDAAIAPANPRRVRIRVSDDGPGIPAAQREAVLRRGLRLDQRGGEGSGFGLAIVAELLALHGGTITLGDRAGGGLSVEVALPGRSGG